jgi:hypothetical protein
MFVQARLCNFRKGQPALTSGIVVGGAVLDGMTLVIPGGLPSKGDLPLWNGEALCSSKSCSGDISPSGAPFKIVFGSGVDVTPPKKGKAKPHKQTYTITFTSYHVKIIVNVFAGRSDVRIEADQSLLTNTSGFCGNANDKAADDAIPNKWKIGKVKFGVDASVNAFPSSVPECPRKGDVPKEKKCSADAMQTYNIHCETKFTDSVDIEDCAFDCCQGLGECPAPATPKKKKKNLHRVAW